MRRDYPALRDSEAQDYISALGDQLIKSNRLGRYDYSFTVVDVPIVNAFALPAGKVYVTAPLIASCQSEAELAGVIGHEIGHVESHHAAKKIRAIKKAQSEGWMYGAGGAVAGHLLAAGVASVVCGSSATCQMELIALGTSAGINGGLLIQKYRFLANSQTNELEADRIGFLVAAKAGFTPERIGDFYRRLPPEPKSGIKRDPLRDAPAE